MPPPDPAAIRARQKRTLLILATVLILSGAAVLLFLSRIPLPFRLLIGLSDLIAGCVILVVVRQKFGPPPPAP
jgi:hypothetical protein